MSSSSSSSTSSFCPCHHCRITLLPASYKHPFLLLYIHIISICSSTCMCLYCHAKIPMFLNHQSVLWTAAATNTLLNHQDLFYELLLPSTCHLLITAVQDVNMSSERTHSLLLLSVKSSKESAYTLLMPRCQEALSAHVKTSRICSKHLSLKAITVCH